ncbi:tetratricopeptide repeat protein [Roseibium aestuarii]|uniref:Tetratricopeptide repeat protein n=1 Tax=Roseibium aestuarii TaxID=2600299 RepID=A0ABW4JSR9_9HYPH|nr:tetratricopeptide repeat protein [Roseibium aestuarii]
MAAKQALRAPAQPTLVQRLQKALALQKAGEVEQAKRIYQAVLKKTPQSADANHLLGVCYRQLGDPDKALDYIQRAIAIAPDRAPFYANLARTLSDMPHMDPQSVMAAADKALSLDPLLVEALNLKGIALSHMERKTEAEQIFRQLIAAHPGFVDAYRNYGVLLRDNKDHDKAVVFFDKAAQLDPGNPENFVQRSRSRLEIEDYDRARVELQDALRRFPTNADLLHEVARLMFKTGETAQGLPFARKAAELDPNNLHKHVTLGVTLHGVGEFEEAIEAFLTAIRLSPTPLPTAEWNLSLAYLAAGRLKEGYALHHRRFDDKASACLRRIFKTPAWQGEDISGKRLLVWTDQGMGDAIRNVSMLREVQAVAGEIILEPPLKMKEILRRNFPDIPIRTQSFNRLTLETDDEDFDVQVSLSDLAVFFRKSIEDFARAPQPTLQPDMTRAASYITRFSERERLPVVGLAWRSGELAAARARWYMSILETAPILRTEGAIFVNLQYSAIEREIRFVREGLGIDFHAFDDIDLRDDIEGAAALTACCDLVISSNTSVADLAGALGTPCWRFGPPNGITLLGQQNPPWHPSVTYYRIPADKPSEWIAGPLSEDLRAWVDRFAPEDRPERLRQIAEMGAGISS